MADMGKFYDDLIIINLYDLLSVPFKNIDISKYFAIYLIKHLRETVLKYVF